MSFFKQNSFVESENYFLVPRNLIKLFGFWPGVENIKKPQIVFLFFNAIIILVYGIFQVNFCIANIENVELFINGLMPVIAQVVTSEKIIMIFVHRKNIKKVLDRLLALFTDGWKI